VDHAERITSFPWRTATLVASAIATLELLVLAIGATVLLAHPFRHHHGTTLASPARTAAKTTHHATAAIPAVAPPSHPILVRTRLHVLVLNGNGVQGAAATAASKLTSLGYRISGSTNAPRHDYARTLVMYRPGFGREAHRLARDGGYALVSPVDGLTPAALTGSQLVVILGR
jgi:hypothetical protein